MRLNIYIQYAYSLACEDSMHQMKQDITTSIGYTTDVQQTYSEIVKQIEEWVDSGLVVKPGIDSVNKTIKDLDFITISEAERYIYIYIYILSNDYCT